MIKPNHLKLAAIMLAIVMLLSGCGSKASAAEVDEMMKEELAHAFATALRTEIIPYKDTRSVLYEMGLVVSEEEYVDDFDLLYAFVEDFEAARECELTTAFFSRAFVVTRIVYIDGAGYYFRYEYDRFNKNQISISFKAVSSVELEENEALEMCTLTLHFSRNDQAVFTFRLNETPVRSVTEIED